MIDKKEFKKMAKKILRSDKAVVNPKLMHPTREWGIGLFIGLIILTISAVWSVEIYLSYRSTSFDEVSDGNEVVVYRASLVEGTLDLFAKRANVYETLLSVGGQAEPAEENILDQDLISNDVSTTSDEVIIDPVLEVENDLLDEEVADESEESVDSSETVTPQLAN